MTYDGKQVANYILDFCQSRDRPVTNLALQKIIYFCHVWSLVALNKALIRHQFEAWPFGPVLQYVYREFKEFDDRPICSRAYRLNLRSGQKEIATYSFDTETNTLLERVVDFYSRINPCQLVDLSHAEDGPWAKVWWHKGKINPGMKIDDGDIKAYYSKANADYEKISLP